VSDLSLGVRAAGARLLLAVEGRLTAASACSVRLVGRSLTERLSTLGHSLNLTIKRNKGGEREERTC
jgi:hypothetical protein